MHSQTAEYALRAMACLAMCPCVLTTPMLAEQARVPVNYLAKVLQLLATARLVEGRRGVGGGYRLARAPEAISLLQVLEAVDEIDKPSRCARPSGKVACPLHRTMEEAVRAFKGVFAHVTLRDLMDEGPHQAAVCGKFPKNVLAS